MNRLDKTFKKLAKKDKKALIPFITAGHPHPLMTVPAMHALVNEGANIIELGMPFSDPMADGVVIQQSSEIALKNGMNLSLVLDIVSEFREQDDKTPVVLMGYLNPIEKFGYHKYVNKAAEVGVDGLLIVDSPPEESEELVKLLAKNNIHQIFLIAPTTGKKRQKYILSMASGFVYCVALKGVTGANQSDFGNLEDQISSVRNYSKLPLAVGFGVKDANSAQAVAKYADVVVIGSALVEKLGQCENQNQIEDSIKSFLKPIRKSINKSVKG